MQIDIFGFIEDGNIGDPVIGETCRYLVEKICKKNNIDADIRLNPLFPPPNWQAYWITRFLRKRCRKQRKNLSNLFTFLVFKFGYIFGRTLKSYYKNTLKNSDMVIFAGGGMLKFVSQDFWASDYCILNYCEKHNIPVYFNAVGIEGYDENNFFSKLLKKLTNFKCIKDITTRDDYEALSKYLDKDCSDKIVGDPALFSNEIYQKQPQKDLIGLNMIRSGIFRVNGHNTTEEDVINFYVEMIKRLNKKGMKWQIFTNGVRFDNNVGIKVLDALGIKPSEENIVDLPKTSQELVDLITSYKAIIGGRMHAHIIAASFDIPTVGTIWNDKIKWFAKHLGCEERFFMPEEMSNYDKVFSAFEKALNDGNAELNTTVLKQATLENLEKFILNNIKKD